MPNFLFVFAGIIIQLMEEPQLLFQATHLSTLQDCDDISNLQCNEDGSGLPVVEKPRYAFNPIFQILDGFISPTPLKCVFFFLIKWILSFSFAIHISFEN